MSVGNLAMGGRGKTPVAALVARLLVEAGERPAVLSRGYRRRERADEVVVVSDGTHVLADLGRSGDEPLMLARHVPGAAVLVHEVRALAAATAERAFRATVHVLDDGFQHASLARDVDLVIVNQDDLSGRPIPFGRLRTGVGALADVDAVLVDADGATRDEVRARVPPAIPVFMLRRAIGACVPLEPHRRWPAEHGPVVAVAAIARPARFVSALQRAGWSVVASVAFPDHHHYRRRDVERIAAAVRDGGAVAAVTTEKDAVKLLPLRPLPVPVASVPLEVIVEPADDFRQWLIARVNEVRA